jgi:hypothetical protein
MTCFRAIAGTMQRVRIKMPAGMAGAGMAADFKKRWSKGAPWFDHPQARPGSSRLILRYVKICCGWNLA